MTLKWGDNGTLALLWKSPRWIVLTSVPTGTSYAEQRQHPEQTKLLGSHPAPRPVAGEAGRQAPFLEGKAGEPRGTQASHLRLLRSIRLWLPASSESACPGGRGVERQGRGWPTLFFPHRIPHQMLLVSGSTAASCPAYPGACPLGGLSGLNCRSYFCCQPHNHCWGWSCGLRPSWSY